MLRVVRLLLLSAMVWICQAQTLWAQEFTWPDISFARGDGFYLSWIKLGLYWAVFLLWVQCANWVNIDAQQNRVGYSRWNMIMVLPFMGVALLALMIPWFWLSLPLMILSITVPMVLYVRQRNQRVEIHERVFNGAHIRFVLSERLAPLGIKISAERKGADERGPGIKFVPEAAETAVENNANLLAARESEGYVPARELLAGAIERHADTIMLDYTAESMGVRYEIDGVWHNGEAQDRESGDAILVVLKCISALNPAERRARQMSSFGLQQEKTKYDCRIVSQGTKTGERTAIQFIYEGLNFPKLADLGMRDKVVEQVEEILANRQGVVLFSSPPRGGLTALTDAALNSTDRYTRGWVALEDEDQLENEILNITAKTYRGADGQSPATILPGVAREYPDAIVCRDLADATIVQMLCEQADENRLIVGTIRARDAVESLLRVLMLKVSPPVFAAAVVGAINVRLVRKLCPECREAYPPPDALLKQLRIPAGRIEALYRPPTNPEEVCEHCSGIGYIGRTGIFEVLTVTDPFREAMVKTPKLDVLRREAKKAGMRSLQDEGLLLVLKGETSLAELQRVLKG